MLYRSFRFEPFDLLFPAPEPSLLAELSAVDIIELNAAQQDIAHVVEPQHQHDYGTQAAVNGGSGEEANVEHDPQREDIPRHDRHEHPGEQCSNRVILFILDLAPQK